MLEDEGERSAFQDDGEGTVPDALGRAALPADWGAELPWEERPNLGLEVVRVEAPPSLGPNDRFCALEIWTKNRTYHVDITMTCIGVVRRETGLQDERSECVGARLGGGQMRRGNVAELCYPLPMPGTEAVFELTDGTRKKFLVTSVVERIVMQIGSTQVDPPKAEPTWQEITGRSVPPGQLFKPQGR
jgi:hypothetical protein